MSVQKKQATEPEKYNSDDARWQAISSNNLDADGFFFYAVLTTGIYCLPSCSSKLPRRTNVEYFASCKEAEVAGYRACKRCCPGADSKSKEIEQKIIHACRIIEKSDTPIGLEQLADKLSLSPSHFHRLFKKIVGITPKQYALKHKAQRFQQSLTTSDSITEAIYAAGFSSSGSAYDKHQDQLAMQPKIYRNGAPGITIDYGIAPCFLGWLIVAATDRGICAIEFGDDPTTLPDLLTNRFPKAKIQEAGRGFQSLIEEVVRFIQSPDKQFKLPLDIQGTVFQQKVWHALRQIKPSETLSYSEVAERIGKPNAVRAVASACGANKLAVVIPCHRVISKTGKIAGYRWGTERKKKLLKNEEKNI